MQFETLNVEQHNNYVILKISRPQALNALNQVVLSELDQFFSQIKEMKGLRAVIVTGDGEKSFVAGADIKEMVEMDSQRAEHFARRGQKLLQKIEDCPVPTIAAINGFALGGGFELAMSCDIMLASTKAKIGLPEVSLGLIPGYGGTQRLSRFVGKSIARRMALSGDIVSAVKAQEWGLFADVVEPEALLPTAIKLAQEIASRSPAAVALAKQAINQGFELEQSAGLELEAKLFGATFKTKDHLEGIHAFIEKRPPQFTGQ